MENELPKIDDSSLTWQPPEIGNWDNCNWHRWETVCGRYRVMRLAAGDRSRFAVEYLKSAPQHGGGDHQFWDFIANDKNVENGVVMSGTYAKEFRLLHTAMEAAERFHSEQTGNKITETNREEVVNQAEKENIADLKSLFTTIGMKRSSTSPSTTGESTVSATATAVTEFSRAELVKLFEEIGVVNVRKWGAVAMLKNMKQVAKWPADELEKATGGNKKVLEEMLAAVNANEKIQITGFDEPKAGAPPKVKGKPSTKASANGKAHKEPKATKPAKAKKEPSENGAGKDKFGARIGSRNAAITAVLTHKAKSMADLVKEAGLEGTFYDHLNKLIKGGHVAKTEDNLYKLV